MGNHRVTRREFLERTGNLAAAGAVGSLLPFGRLWAADEPPTPGESDWTRFGYDLHNTRFNAKEKIIGPNNVDRLKVKWQFDTLDSWPVQTTPTVIGDTLFFGAGGYYYGLESRTGKLKWRHETGVAGDWIAAYKNRATRSSAQYVDGKIYYGDGFCNVNCADAATGQLLWKTNLEKDPLMNPSMMYSPVVYKGKVLVGYTASNPQIACLDAETGAIRWRFRVAQDVPVEWKTGGGSLWTSGAVDEQQNVVFNATGSNKSFMPPGPMRHTESILAHDIDTGELLWAFQAHAHDAFDLDFCAHPMVFDAVAPQRLRGHVRQCVGAGNKGGFYCLNRYTGELYWKVMLGAPSSDSGPRTNATAVAYNKVFIQYCSPTSRPALAVTAALNAYNGDVEWIIPNPNVQTSPLAVANGVLYQGFLISNKVEALDAKTGRRLWEHALPSDFRGGVSIANGALYTSNGEAHDWEGEKVPHKFSVFCFTIDGQ